MERDFGVIADLIRFHAHNTPERPRSPMPRSNSTTARSTR